MEIEATAAGQMTVLREKQSVSRSLQRQRPSVADLRESFERISRPAEKDGGPKTPAKLRTSMSTSMCYTNSKRVDCSPGDALESSRRPIATLYHSPSRRLERATNPVTSTGTELDKKPSWFFKQDSPSRSYPALPSRTTLALPTSKSSRSRLGMSAKSKTEAPSSCEDKQSDLSVQLQDADMSERNRHSGNDCPHSSSIHPPLISSSEAATTTTEGGKPAPISEKLSLSNSTVPNPNCWIKELGTDIDLSLPTEVHSASECRVQPSHRLSRVAGLRRLFDRSSPRPLAAFCRQRQTLPKVESLCMNLERDESPMSSSFVAPSPTSQKACTLPALTTEIGVNDFSHSFLDGDAALLYNSSPVNPKSRRDLPLTALPRASLESLLQQRIIKFEHMIPQSEAADMEIHAFQSQRQESTLATDSSPLDMSVPVPVAPKPGRKGQPMRSVWRRISNSFTQSLDSSSDSYSRHQGEGRYHSSYRESSHNYAGSTPPQSPHPPLRASRRSFPFLQRLSTRGSSQIFGLDGSNHSVPSAEVWAGRAAANCDLSPVGSPGSTSHADHEDMRKLAHTQTQRDLKAQKKAKKLAEKQELRERRRWRRMEKDIEKLKPRNVRGISSGAAGTQAVATSTVAPGESSRAETTYQCAEGAVREQERSWDKQTASGFVVRQTCLGSQELAHPKPDRPGQVRKIVDLYKEKSSSMLRIASGHLSVGRARTRSDARDEGKAKGMTGETGSTD